MKMLWFSRFSLWSSEIPEAAIGRLKDNMGPRHPFALIPTEKPLEGTIHDLNFRAIRTRLLNNFLRPQIIGELTQVGSRTRIDVLIRLPWILLLIQLALLAWGVVRIITSLLKGGPMAFTEPSTYVFIFPAAVFYAMMSLYFWPDALATRKILASHLEIEPGDTELK